MVFDEAVLESPISPIEFVPGSGSKYVQVSAGPGTGKTTGLCETLTTLIRDDGVSANRILVVSFTRASAGDLTAELRSAERAIPDADDIQIGTLHSECFRILMRAQHPKSQGRVPRPLMDFERHVLEADLSRGHSRDVWACRRLINAFEAEWARSQEDDPGFPSAALDQQFQYDLMHWLRYHRCMLIGEVIPETRRLLAVDHDQPILSAYDYVFVDEYQDLNRADQEVIFKLASIPKARLTVLGDENQSIYSFRHAHPEGLRSFPNGRPGGLERKTHDKCYRCPPRVVDMANNLIANNVTRAEHMLAYGSEAVGEVEYRQADSVDEEAAGIACWISEVIARSQAEDTPIHPQDCLILVPRKAIGHKIVTELKKARVAARTIFREELLDSDASQRAMILLTLATDPLDRVAFRCWLTLGFKDKSKQDYQRLLQACGDEASPKAFLQQIDEKQARKLRLIRVWKLASELEGELNRLAGVPAPELVDMLIPATDPSLSELREISVRAALEEGTPSELLFAIRESILKNDPGPDEIPAVRVMTYHSAKGLSAKVVVLGSVIQGLMPCFSEEEEDHDAALRRLEEQRRLFYVGVTRARNKLLLSSFSRSYSNLNAHTLHVVDQQGVVPPRRIRPSVFLTELRCPEPVPHQSP